MGKSVLLRLMHGLHAHPLPLAEVVERAREVLEHELANA